MTGWKSGSGLLVLDRETEKAYTVHTACLSDLRDILREAGWEGERFAEMGPTAPGDVCGKCAGELGHTRHGAIRPQTYDGFITLPTEKKD